MYVVSVLFEIKPDNYADFSKAVIRQADNSLDREPDCQRFDVCESPNDNPNQIYLYEIYTDEAAFQAHLKSDHFLEFDAMVMPWLESKTVSTWNLISS